MGRTTTYRFDGTRQSQAGVTDIFAMCSGRQPPPKCPTCGGIKAADAKHDPVPPRARCVCPDGGWARSELPETQG